MISPNFLKEQPMTTSAVPGSTNQQYSSYASTGYVPETSEWTTSLLCEDVLPNSSRSTQKCCSSIKTIDRAIDKAYQNGLQSHPGIATIENYPCVSGHEMGRLSNDLHDKIQAHGIEMNLPEGLNPMKRPLGVSMEIMNYCKEVVFEKLARELNRVSDSKPIAFTNQVLKYCKFALTLRPSPINPSFHRNEGWD